MKRRSATSGGEDAAAEAVPESKRARRRGSAHKPAAASESDGPAADALPRCQWAGAFTGASAPQYLTYHDTEWGRPVHDDRQLFELLILEGAQAGLSWSTVLARRDAYRRAFKGFDPAQVAAFGEPEISEMLAEGSGVIRHRGKLESAVKNAKVFLELQRQHGSFSNFVWSFVPCCRPIVNNWTTVSQVPAKTPESEALSGALKKTGMSFVGPTIMYAFMQAAGLVNDHTTECHCRQPIIDSYEAAADPSDGRAAAAGSAAATGQPQAQQQQQPAAASRRRCKAGG